MTFDPPPSPGVIYPSPMILVGSADADILIGGPGNDTLTGGLGNDFLDGGNGADYATWSTSSTHFTLGYAGGTWTIRDQTGSEGVDTVVNVEKLQFSDKTVTIESKAHGAYGDLPNQLYQFFAVAFNAAPGVEYMDQLAEAYRFGLSVKQIVDIFTTKHQFTDAYPSTLGHLETATTLVANIVKNSATTQAKNEAIGDITYVLDAGWSMGDVIYTVFGNLANKPLTDASWGNTAQQFLNEVAVAKFYTETMGQSTSDLATLRSVLAPVTDSVHIATDADLVALIGVGLLQ